MHRRARSGGPRPSPLRSTRRLLTIALVVTVAATGCARFDESVDTPFRPAPSLQPQEVIPPAPERDPETDTSAQPEAPTAGNRCPDPDPAVIATCLDVPVGIAVLPGGQSALVAERLTGRIVEVFRDGREPVEVATIPVDSSGDGGLLDLALSPTYAEDRLVYAYLTTSSDNRVVRIAPGDVPKPVFVGIPRGAQHNAGAIDFAGPDNLLILTGDAGSASAAADPGSQAGKVLSLSDLRVSDQSKPVTVAMSGVNRAGGLCPGADGTTWVTDTAGGIDRLHRIGADGVVGPPVWTWPDAPGVAGCAAGESGVAVAFTTARAIAVLSIDPQTGVVGTAPALLNQDRYGQFYGAAVASDTEVWVTTTNRGGPAPAATDDRVVVVIPQLSGGSGPD